MISPKIFLPTFTEILKRSEMYYRDGSEALSLRYVALGRLIGYLEIHIDSCDCLGALAVIRAAGLPTNDFLDNDGLNEGNTLFVGREGVFSELSALAAEHSTCVFASRIKQAGTWHS